jgi:hypothetical protein
MLLSRDFPVNFLTKNWRPWFLSYLNKQLCYKQKSRQGIKGFGSLAVS